MNLAKRTLAATLCGVAVLGMAKPSFAQEHQFRASGSFTAGHTSSMYMETFASEVARLTENAIKVDLFPGNVLGGAYEQVDQIRTGSVQFAWAGTSFYSGLLPQLDAATLPFASPTPEHAFCVIDSGLGEHISNAMAEKGVLILGWGSGGHRHTTNNVRPIKAVEDLKGLKVRVPPSDTYLNIFRAVGANPTPIDIKELYQALQQGVVDGQENPYDNILVRNFHEVQKYLANTGHLYGWVLFLMHKGTYDKLTPEHQNAVHRAMDTAVAAQRVANERANVAALQKLKEKGIQYDELPAAELEKFREATRGIYVSTRERVGAEPVDLATKLMGECAKR